MLENLTEMLTSNEQGNEKSYGRQIMKGGIGMGAAIQVKSCVKFCRSLEENFRLLIYLPLVMC